MMTEPRPDYENDHARDIPPRVATYEDVYRRLILTLLGYRDRGDWCGFWRQLAKMAAMVEGEE